MEQMSREEAEESYRRDPAQFFDALLKERTDDRALINTNWSWMETKYHYNIVENEIIDYLFSQTFEISSFRVLDIGVGNGHWIDFYLDIVGVKEIVGIDFSETAIERQRQRFSDDDRVTLFVADVSDSVPELAPFDLINAIGVIFHIVDDEKWERALDNIATLFLPHTAVIVGGDFGEKDEMRGVMRKVRSRSAWEAQLARRGMCIERVRRFEWFRGADAGGITDNILIFRKCEKQVIK